MSDRVTSCDNVIQRTVEKEARRARKKAYLATRAILRARFPEVFPPRGQPLSPPLKIGVHHDLLAIPDLGVSKNRLNRFLGRWTRRSQYRRAMVEGAVRHALDGTPDGTVTAGHAAHALVMLEQRRERNRDEKRARRAARKQAKELVDAG